MKSKHLFFKINLENKVILAGYVSKAEASLLYKNASLYVFPSLDEGFGIPISRGFIIFSTSYMFRYRYF